MISFSFLIPSRHYLVQLLDHQLNGDLGVSGKHGNLADLRNLGPALAFVSTGVALILFFISQLLLPYLLLLGNLPLFVLRIFLLLLLGLLLRVFSLLQEHLSSVSDSSTQSIVAAAVRVTVRVSPVITVRVRAIFHACSSLLSHLLLLTLPPWPPVVVAVVIVILLLILITTLILGFWVKLGDVVSHVLSHILAQFLPQASQRLSIHLAHRLPPCRVLPSFVDQLLHLNENANIKPGRISDQPAGSLSFCLVLFSLLHYHRLCLVKRLQQLLVAGQHLVEVLDLHAVPDALDD